MSFIADILSISSLEICIFSLLNIYFKFTVFYHRSDCQNALQHAWFAPILDMLSRLVEIWAWHSFFIVGPDQE